MYIFQRQAFNINLCKLCYVFKFKLNWNSHDCQLFIQSSLLHNISFYHVRLCQNIHYCIKYYFGRYFILWDIVDPRTKSNPNSNPNHEHNPKPNPNPNPYPNCGFIISHKMKYLRLLLCMPLALITVNARITGQLNSIVCFYRNLKSAYS